MNQSRETAEYQKLMEQASRIRASGLEGDYRALAEFNNVVQGIRPDTGWNLLRGSGCKTTRLCGKGTITATAMPPPSRTSQPAPGLSRRSAFSATSSSQRCTAAFNDFVA